MKRLAVFFAFLLAIVPAAVMAADVSTPPPTYTTPNGGIAPTAGVAMVGRDTGTGLMCWKD